MMNEKPMKHMRGNELLRLSVGTLLLIVVSFLSGCASTWAYRESNALFAEGKPVEGLAKLEEAVKMDPHNLQYRIALGNKRMAIMNAILVDAETHIREGRLAEAEAAYKFALKLDPNQPMATQGLEALRAESRHRQLVTHAAALIKQESESALKDAEEKLRAVLSENNRQQGAKALMEQINEIRAKAVKEGGRLAVAYRKPITLELRDATVSAVFDMIAQVSGLRFFFDQEVRQDTRTTIFAKDTTIEDVIRMVLATTQLEQKVLSDNAVLIFPNTPQKLRAYQTLMVRSFYVSNADVKAVAATLKSIVKLRDMSVDERLGLIIVRDTPEAIRVAERVVALQDLSDPEVMLEVEVLEVKRSRLLELGIQWPGQMTLTALPSDKVLTLQDLKGLDRGRIGVSSSGAIVNARKDDQDGNTLANPRIRVRNKEKAKIMIGDRVPVISSTSTATGFLSESITYLDVGLKLEVEPTVYADEEVGIKISLDVSTLIKEILSKSGALAYQIGTRGVSTVLRLKNGETQVLAGLISDEDRTSASKIPILGELPVLGRLFGSQKDDTQRSEILLSITPRILRGVPRSDLRSIEFDSGTEANIGAPSLSLVPMPEKSGSQGEAAGR